MCFIYNWHLHLVSARLSTTLLLYYFKGPQWLCHHFTTTSACATCAVNTQVLVFNQSINPSNQFPVSLHSYVSKGKQMHNVSYWVWCTTIKHYKPNVASTSSCCIVLKEFRAIMYKGGLYRNLNGLECVSMAQLE